MPETLTAPAGKQTEVQFMADTASRFEAALVKDGKLAPSAPPPAKVDSAAAPVTTATTPAAKGVPDFAPDAAATNATSPEPDDFPDTPNAPLKSSDWKALKESRNNFKTQTETLQKRAEEAEKKLAELAAKPAQADQTQVDALRKQVEDYEKRLQTVAIERDPKFENYYGGKINGIITQAKTIAGANGEKIATLLSMPDSVHRNEQLDAAIQELRPLEQARIGALVNQMESVMQERNAQIQNASQNFKAIQAHQAEQAKASQSKITEAMASEMERAKKHLPIFQPRDGDEEWNRAVQQRLDVAQNIISGQLTPGDLAKAAMWSAAGHGLLQEIASRDAEITALRKQVTGLSKANPNPATSRGEVATKPDTSKMSYADAIMANMGMKR